MDGGKRKEKKHGDVVLVSMFVNQSHEHVARVGASSVGIGVSEAVC